MEFTELSPELLAQAQATATTGSYRKILEEFNAADVSSADVTSAFPGKKPATISGGLKNAKRKDASFDTIRVVTLGDVVALVRQ